MSKFPGFMLTLPILANFNPQTDLKSNDYDFELVLLLVGAGT